MLFIRQVDCPGCPPCGSAPCVPPVPPEAGLEDRIASSSVTKCGFPEWTGYVSNPPKYYLVRTLSGTLTYSDYDYGCSTCLTAAEATFRGAMTYESLVCEDPPSASVVVSVYESCSTFYSGFVDPTDDVFNFSYDSTCFFESYTSITHTVYGTNSCNYQHIGTGTAYAVNSYEYTTSDLVANAIATLPAISGPWYGYNPSTEYAYFDISTDEMTCTKTKMEYRFVLDTLNLSGYSCYKITWQEKFEFKNNVYPPIYTAMTYVWNGSATYAGPYTVNAPTTEGKITVVSVAVTCLGC